jgi:hypothetical protein
MHKLYLLFIMPLRRFCLLNRLIIFCRVYDALLRPVFLWKRRDPMVCVVYGLFVVYCNRWVLPMISWSCYVGSFHSIYCLCVEVGCPCVYSVVASFRGVIWCIPLEVFLFTFWCFAHCRVGLPIVDCVFTRIQDVVKHRRHNRRLSTGSTKRNALTALLIANTIYASLVHYVIQHCNIMGSQHA